MLVKVPFPKVIKIDIGLVYFGYTFSKGIFSKGKNCPPLSPKKYKKNQLVVVFVLVVFVVFVLFFFQGLRFLQ